LLKLIATSKIHKYFLSNLVEALLSYFVNAGRFPKRIALSFLLATGLTSCDSKPKPGEYTFMPWPSPAPYTAWVASRNKRDVCEASKTNFGFFNAAPAVSIGSAVAVAIGGLHKKTTFEYFVIEQWRAKKIDEKANLNLDALRPQAEQLLNKCLKGLFS